MFRKGHDENELQKEVSSCVEQRYNVTMHMCDKKRQVEFESVDVVCEPVKHLSEIIESYFTNEINQAFIARFEQSKNDQLHSSTGFVCYYCNCYCTTKTFFEKHLSVCAKKTRSGL